MLTFLGLSHMVDATQHDVSDATVRFREIVNN